ncbi:alpha/beta hydrolase [Janthinobacterium sp.]|uniref:alpha/beta fold hydrolase n=1 Tax=Janthinobacterium sp. TaxID=1871054 RepID=UPI00261D052B|nr:alpha/beta hydrolase [Janthinobacterium sp.]
MLEIGFTGLALIALGSVSAHAWTPDIPLDPLKVRWAKAPSKFIELDGMQVHYRDEGPRDDPAPILLLHGTGNSLHTWDAWAEQLKGKHRVIRFDRPGFGLTWPNPTGDYSMVYFADFAQRFLDALQVRKVTVAGNSAGGRVALYLASRHPERVEKLVLIASAGYPRNTPSQFAFRLMTSRWLAPILTRILPRGQVEANVRNTYGDTTKVRQEVLDRSYELTLREGNRRALVDNLPQAQDVHDQVLVKAIKVPALIMWVAMTM